MIPLTRCTGYFFVDRHALAGTIFEMANCSLTQPCFALGLTGDEMGSVPAPVARDGNRSGQGID